ncbi:MAG: AraC family transcriptional regulator [Draconibacterium sp.]|nr:AraC family transcriptional regulator [Draconibacterium sp.]
MQRVKVEAAKKSFESYRENIMEVMYNVGYSDTKAFRDIFRKYTGLSPNDYKQKYNRVNV